MYMKRSYSLASARSHLAEVIEQLQGSGEIELTRRGKRVAVLVSADRYALMSRTRPSFAEALARFRERVDLDEVGLDRSWATGLRDRRPGRKVEL
jgi:prevent-host-death family protein